MNIDLGEKAEAFRRELRDWLGKNKPKHAMDDSPQAVMTGSEATREWTQKLRENRLLCVSWPEEAGGRGLTGIEVAVLNEEFHEAGVPRITMGMGESLVGPSIVVWGTPEQKAHFLPRIINGEDRYCQGFSEPNSGSDLASLQTRGEVFADEIVINGQKVWTSGAQAANMMFCLCRTDPDAPKHQGISYVLVSMKDNGFDIRPLKQMTGGAGFSEVFIEGARAPLFNVIGGVHNGWKVTMTTLGNERGGSATTQHLRYVREFWDLVKTAQSNGKSEDPRVRQQLAWAYSQVEIMRYSGLRLLAQIAQRREPGPEASINKLFWSEYHKKLGDIAANIVGMASTVRGVDRAADRWQGTMMSARAGTIYAGTSEVQHNIIGERALGLPKEPDSEREAEWVQRGRLSEKV